MNRRNDHPNLRRLRAACALRGMTIDELARRCGVSGPHLRFVITGERRPSARLTAAMQRELGDSWAFVVGETDTLSIAAESNGDDQSGVTRRA